MPLGVRKSRRAVSYERTENLDARVQALTDEELAYMNVGAFDPKGAALSIIGNAAFSVTGAAAWGDVITLAPWTLYQMYGDASVLRETYPAMRAWVDYEARQSRRFSAGKRQYLWDHGFQFGDWLAPGEDIGASVRKGKWVATAYFARSAWIVSQTAEILGFPADAKRYGGLFDSIRDAFQSCYLDAGGHIKNGFQTIYVLAIVFDLLTEAQKRTTLADLCTDIASHGGHLATGFPGTPFLNFALSDNGKSALAYDLLFQETAPGWLYPVKCGATSIWERWDALREDGSVNLDKVGNGSMVSFNHYAYGAVGEWLNKRVCGVDPIEPGFRKFRVAPLPDPRLRSASLRFASEYGEIESSWETDGDRWSLHVEVPCNTTAEIWLPDGNCLTRGSGSYDFSLEIQRRNG